VLTTSLSIAGGLILLLAGGESLVRGSVAVARSLKVSPLLIGLTLVGFGTSTPELVTSLEAALAGSPGIAIGNVVGSNIANILLILGIAALLRPFACHPGAFRRDGAVLIGSALLGTGVMLFGAMTRPAGLILVVLLVAYVVWTYLTERGHPESESAALHAGEAGLAEPVPARLGLSLALAAGGIAMTILGARLLVNGTITLAREAGISETLLGLTLVAVGTSLPELVTSVIAALRRQGEIAFGNIVGSNIYNILGILGVTALVHPIAVPPEVLRLDVWVMIAATFLLAAFTVTGWRISRLEGGVFLAGYVGYIAFLAV
jgi:cation:H+ antiporter